MAKRYLQLDWKTSNLFEYSKNPKEGFETHTTENGTSYRKYEKKGVTGELLNIGVRDSKIGQQLSLSFKVGEDIVVTQFNLYDQRNQVDSNYPESIIVHLGNLKKGETYTIFPYNLTADTQKQYDEQTEGREVRAKYYDKRAVSFKQNGVKVNTYLTYVQGESNSIPKLEWKEDRFNPGKKKPTAASLEAKNEFLLDELDRAVKGHLAYENSNATPQTNTKPQSQPQVQEEEEDLPF